MNARDFLMVGDSWGEGMKGYFPNNVSISSSGFWGRQSATKWLPGVDEQIRNANYSNGVIIVHSGGNDIAIRGTAKDGKQSLFNDVKRAVDAAKAKGCKIIFVSAPWLNHKSSRVTSNRDKYNSWLKEAVDANGASYIDTNPMIDYMRQHQPKLGNFHLNDYSGYAQYILNEANKLISGNIKPLYQQPQNTYKSNTRKKPKRSSRIS